MRAKHQPTAQINKEQTPQKHKRNGGVPERWTALRHSPTPTLQFWRACIAEKWEVVRLHNWQVSALEGTDLAIYGEPLFAHHVAQTLGRKLEEPPLDFLPKLPAKWRGRDVRLSTLAEARKISTRAFIKPADEKCFDAKIYWSGAELPPLGVLPGDLPVLVQAVVQWDLEFRCFCLDRKVVTLSPYWRNNQLAQANDGLWPASGDELQNAKEFCERVLANDSIDLPAAIVLDVGMMKDFGWAVVECNAAFSSGLYGCDPVSVLQLLRRACTPVDNFVKK